MQQEINELKRQIIFTKQQTEQLITSSQSLSNDTKLQVSNLEQQVKILERQQSGLMHEYEKRQKIVEEQKSIQKFQELRVFYDTTRLKLTEIFLAAKVYKT